MTLTVLASVSLLALVSTARPLVKNENREADVNVVPNELVSNVVETLLASNSGLYDARVTVDDPSQDIEIHMTSTEEIHAYLSELDDEAVHVLVSLTETEDLRTADEQQLHDILARIEAEKDKGRETPVPDDMLDEFVSIPQPEKAEDAIVNAEFETTLEVAANDDQDVKPISQLEVGESMEMPGSSNSVVILFLACGLALLVAGLFGLMLYIIESTRRPRETMQGYLMSRLELGQGSFRGFTPPPPRPATANEKPHPSEDVAPGTFDVFEEPLQESSLIDSTLSEKPLIIFDDPEVESVYDSADEDLDEKDYELEPMSVYATPLLQGLDMPSDDEDELEAPDPELFKLPSIFRSPVKSSSTSHGEQSDASVAIIEDESELKTPTQAVFSSPSLSLFTDSPRKRRPGTPGMPSTEAEGRAVPAWAALAALDTQSPTRYPNSLSSGFAPCSPSPDSKLRLRSHARSKSSALATPLSTPMGSRPSTPSPVASSSSATSNGLESESANNSNVVKVDGPAPKVAPARRAFAAFPEMDAVALGMMQLRPILGMDPSWLLRFVVTLFGWCAVWVSGSGSGR